MRTIVVTDGFGARSEGFFRILVENALDMVMIVDAESRPLYVNPVHERILGYTVEELMELRPPELLNPEDHERVMGEFAGVIANPGSTSGFVEGRYRHKDGSWRWLEGIGINLLDDPAVNGLLICSRDITERKEAEERERFLSLLTRNSPDFVSVVNPDFSLRYISPSIEPMLGYTQEEFTAFMLSDVIHPDDVEDVMNDMAGAANPGLNPVREYRYRHRDGSWRWFEAVANNLLDDPGMRAAVVNLRDITERKEAEAEILRLNETLGCRVAERTAELKESEEQLRTAFEVAAVGMAQTNTNGRYLRANPRLCEMLGYTEEELLARTFQEITHSDDLDAELEYVQKMLSGEIKTYSMEKRYLTRIVRGSGST